MTAYAGASAGCLGYVADAWAAAASMPCGEFAADTSPWAMGGNAACPAKTPLLDETPATVPDLDESPRKVCESEGAPKKIPSMSAIPRKVHDLRLGELKWEEIASGREQRTVLRLIGLPKRYCDVPALERLLAKAGLQDMVGEVHTRRPSAARGGRQLGGAVLHVTSPAHVPAVAKFFHGRVLCGSVPVSVSFASGPVVLGKHLKPQALSPRKISFGMTAQESDTTGTPKTPRGSTTSDCPNEAIAQVQPAMLAGSALLSSAQVEGLAPPGC